MLGIVGVTERNEGRCGGTYREYSLDMDPKLILSAMESTVEIIGVHESVVNTALAEDVIDQEEADSSVQTTLD